MAPRILVVSVESNALDITGPLHDAGYDYRLVSAIGGVKALTANAWEPSLTIMDANFSRRAQYQMYTQLRRELSSPLLILVPAQDYAEIREQAGVHTSLEDHMPVPFGPTDLLQKLAEMLPELALPVPAEEQALSLPAPAAETPGRIESPWPELARPPRPQSPGALPGRRTEPLPALESTETHFTEFGASQTPDQPPAYLAPSKSPALLERSDGVQRLANPHGLTLNDGVELRQGTQKGVLVGIFSTKGGVGKTTLASNLASSAAAARFEVLLADCDLHFGGIASALDLPRQRTWIEAMDFAETQDEAAIVEALTPAGRGANRFYAVLSPGERLVANQLQDIHLTSVLDAARDYFDLIIADLHAAYDDVTMGVLERCDVILLVITPEIATVRNIQNFLQLWQKLEYEETKIHLVVNRYNSGVTKESLEKALGRPIFASIESAGRMVVDSMNAGVPFVRSNPTAPISQNIAQLLSNLNITRDRRKAPSGQHNDLTAGGLVPNMQTKLPTSLLSRIERTQ